MRSNNKAIILSFLMDGSTADMAHVGLHDCQYCTIIYFAFSFSCSKIVLAKLCFLCYTMDGQFLEQKIKYKFFYKIIKKS
jgi:hypothetical protein